MNTIVIYHSADFDGIFSREVARHFLKDTAEYIGWDYGDPLPVIPLECERLYMIDISVDELMGHPGLIWIDHHATAIAKFNARIPGYRIDGVAACRLAWQWFTHVLDADSLPGKQAFVDRKVSEPWAIRLAGEHDVWDHRDPNAALFQHGLRSQDIDFERLMEIPDRGSGNYVRELLEAGGYVAHASREGLAYLVREGSFDLEFEGLRFLAINAAIRNSAAFVGFVRPDHDGTLSFVWSAKKGKWKISMRGVEHKPDFDLSVIASKHGGGGHKQACGFECAVLPFGLGTPPADGIAVIAAERARQLAVEGWTPAHDDQHALGQLAAAATCYAHLAMFLADTGKVMRLNNVRAEDLPVLSSWPWEPHWWKPSSDPFRNLAKSGALLAAEIDRLKRAKAKQGGAS